LGAASVFTTDAAMPVHAPVEDIPALVWVTAFETGDAKVDRELLVDINELSRCLAEGRNWSQIVRISRLLRDKCFAHFRDERAVLQNSKYSKLAAHERQHRYISNSSTMFSPASAASRGPCGRRLKRHSFFARC
jgi:hemerythrin